MKGRANTTVSVLRGTTTDAFGDPADTATVVASGITASIVEQGKTVTTKVDGMVRQVRRIVGRLPAGTDIQSGDRIKDEKTSRIYVFDASADITNAVRRNDLRLDLRRIT